MKLINVPKINRWAKGTWVWNGKRFETLKEAKTFLYNAVLDTPLYTLITEYEGYDYIAHYDNEGIIASIVEIIPENATYRYTKTHRVGLFNSGHTLKYVNNKRV